MEALPNNDPRTSLARKKSLRGGFAAMNRSNHLLAPSPQADFGNNQQQVQLAVDDRRSLKRRCKYLPISAPPLPFGNNDEPTPALYRWESSPITQRRSKRCTRNGTSSLKARPRNVNEDQCVRYMSTSIRDTATQEEPCKIQ